MPENNTYFRLGEVDFGVGKVMLAVDRQVGSLSVEVIGNEELTQRLSAKPDGPFSWVLYPPKLYLRAVLYTTTSSIVAVTVDEQLLDEFDVALYLLEHHDVYGILTIADNTFIEFEGITQLDGETIKLSVRCESNPEIL